MYFQQQQQKKKKRIPTVQYTNFFVHAISEKVDKVQFGLLEELINSKYSALNSLVCEPG
jgi:hypothetical protein